MLGWGVAKVGEVGVVIMFMFCSGSVIMLVMCVLLEKSLRGLTKLSICLFRLGFLCSMARAS